MHVLVAGCGWLGQAIAVGLRRRGHRVTGVRRDPTQAAALAAFGLEGLAVDLAAPDALARLPGDVDAVVSCAAAGGDGVAAYRAAYVDVNRTLLALAARRPVSALVYTSSTGVFGQRDGSDVDEATPPAPASPSAEVLVEAERLVLGDPRVPASVVRLSGLYGPGRTGVVERVRSGAMGLGPGDDAWMNWCHGQDAVAATLAALARGRPGAVYHATDAHPPRRREVVEWIAARLGIPPPRSAAPPPPGPNRRILGERTRAELGLTLAYPSFREGLDTLLPR